MLQHFWNIALLYLILFSCFFVYHGGKIAPVLYIYSSTGMENNTERVAEYWNKGVRGQFWGAHGERAELDPSGGLPVIELLEVHTKVLLDHISTTLMINAL